MLANGDKLMVTKKISSFLNEGDIVKVVNVDENGMISFAFGEEFMHMGIMNTAECEAHFKKIENEVMDATITQKYIDEIMSNSDFMVDTVFDKCTVVSCRLPNGFVIVEHSACVSPENYDEELGVDTCLNKIADKIWELEGYRLQEELSRGCCTGTDCYNCYCDECSCGEPYDDYEEDDLCLDTDIDCDDCEDFDCPYNSNIHNI